MADVPPKRGEAYTLYFSVTDQANTNIFRANPTIAAGDFQYSNDAGATFNNPGTLPSAVAGNNKVIQAPLTGPEMTPSVGDKILFAGSDQVGAEWQDILIVLTTTETPTGEIASDVWSYATRTLTSFGTLVADIVATILASALVANIWTYATRTLTSFGTLVADIVSALLDVPAVRTARQQIQLELYRGDTWEQNIWRLGDISTRTKLWVTARFQRDDADSTSAFQIEESAGLLYIAGGPAAVAGNGSITVVDAAAGSITVRLEAVETAKLDALNKLYYDVQWTDGTDVETPRRGRLLVISDVTRATS